MRASATGLGTAGLFSGTFFTTNQPSRPIKMRISTQYKISWGSIKEKELPERPCDTFENPNTDFTVMKSVNSR